MKCNAEDVTVYSIDDTETQHTQFEQGVQQCGDKLGMAGATMLHILDATKAKTCYLLVPLSL